MRKIFHEHFPSDAAAETVLKWIPKWQDNVDPSGRASNVHLKTVQKPSHAPVCAVENSIVTEQQVPQLA